MTEPPGQEKGRGIATNDHPGTAATDLEPSVDKKKAPSNNSCVFTREDLQTFLRQPIAFHRLFATIAGSVGGGVFLSQLYYWSDKTHNPGGWVYKTAEQWFDETTLTRNEIDTIRKSLKRKGIIGEKLAGVPAKLHYKIDWDAFFSCLKTASEEDRKRIEKREEDRRKRRKIQFVENQQTELRKTSKLVCRKPANKSVEKPETIVTEITPETTSENTAAAEDDTKREASDPPTTVPEEAAAASAKANGEQRATLQPEPKRVASTSMDTEKSPDVTKEMGRAESGKQPAFDRNGSGPPSYEEIIAELGGDALVEATAERIKMIEDIFPTVDIGKCRKEILKEHPEEIVGIGRLTHWAMRCKKMGSNKKAVNPTKASKWKDPGNGAKLTLHREVESKKVDGDCHQIQQIDSQLKESIRLYKEAMAQATTPEEKKDIECRHDASIEELIAQRALWEKPKNGAIPQRNI
jgi:hypothetical protein